MGNTIKKPESKVYNKVISVVYLDAEKGEKIKNGILRTLDGKTLFSIAAVEHNLECKFDEIVNVATAMEEIEFIYKAVVVNVYSRFTIKFGSLYKDEPEFIKNQIAKRIFDILTYFGTQNKNYFMLYYGKSYSIEEISTLLDTPERVIRTALFNMTNYIETTIEEDKANKLFSPHADKETKIESIYNTLSEYSKKEVLEGISHLTDDEKEVIYALHGYDLEEPQIVPSNSLYQMQYEVVILPRLRGFINKAKTYKGKSLHL